LEEAAHHHIRAIIIIAITTHQIQLINPTSLKEVVDILASRMILSIELI